MALDHAACHDRYIAGDADEDRLGHKSVLAKVKRHDAEMERIRPVLGLMKAAANTDYWLYVDEVDTVEHDDEDLPWLYDARVEVNRIKPAMTQFIAALYPRRMEAVVDRDVLTTGDPEAAAMILNRIMRQPRNRDRMKMVTRQSLMFGVAGVKVGYDPGESNPVDRVWWVAIPRWELLLDTEARDWSQARYFGHLYYLPKHEVEKDYGLTNLRGTRRDDFLGAHIDDDTKESRDKDRDEDAASDNDDNFVRVLELCNLVDHAPGCSEGDHPGRFEVWVLDQGQGISNCPVYMGAMPLADVRGKPTPHIMPCLLDHEEDFPFRGRSTIKQMMPQQAELNHYRTHGAQLARRDVRVWLAPEGLLTEKTKQKLRRGYDSLVITYKDATSGEGGVLDPERALVPLRPAPISANIREREQLAEQDLLKSVPASPQSLGIVTKATAEEVKTVEAHTESMFGELAEQRDVFIIDLLKLSLRAVIAASYDNGEDDVVEVEAEGDGQAEVEDTGDEASVEEAEGGAESEDDGEKESETPEQPEEPGSSPEDYEEPEYASGKEQTILLYVDGDEIEVTCEQLDSDFDIGLSESGRTPMGDAQRRQDLVSMLEPASRLVETAAKGRGVDPAAALGEWAARWYDELHMVADWPKSLSLEAIFGAVGEQAPQPPVSAQPPAAEPTAPSPQPDNLQALLQMPPERALPVLAQVLAEDYPQYAQVAQQALSAPPEVQAQAVQQIVQFMSEQMGGAPPQQPVIA